MSLPKSKRRVFIIAASGVVILAVAGALVWSQSDPLHSRARRQWASQAIATINQRTGDKPWLEGERSKLKNATVGESSRGAWFRDELLVTKNGEWMICENVCAKEQNTPVRKDIFVGYGSDGRWYYSTFHFCIGKCVLQPEAQPETLAQLVDGFWPSPFDGQPENCLNETWTGGAYGEEKIQSAAAATRLR